MLCRRKEMYDGLMDYRQHKCICITVFTQTMDREGSVHKKLVVRQMYSNTQPFTVPNFHIIHRQ